MKKTTNKNTMSPAEEAARQAANARRLEKMRATLKALEDRAEAILVKGDAMTAADRRELLTLINIAYHTTGKIEGIFSIDGSASCEFCQQMRKAAEDNLLIICGGCYAAADEYKEASWRRHKLNAHILSTVLFTEEELSWLTLPQRADVRINEDGDTVNETHGRNIIRIFRVFPGCNFGYWFKNSPAVDKALHAEGYHRREDLPQNVRFIQSSLLIGFEARPVWFADCVFTVYPDDETTAAAIAAGAFECNGRRCRACGFHCYRPDRSSGKVVFIAEVLRASKAQRARILAAYQARKARISKAG